MARKVKEPSTVVEEPVVASVEKGIAAESRLCVMRSQLVWASGRAVCSGQVGT